VVFQLSLTNTFFFAFAFLTVYLTGGCREFVTGCLDLWSGLPSPLIVFGPFAEQRGVLEEILEGLQAAWQTFFR
jgi:hypothetical protein